MTYAEKTSKGFIFQKLVWDTGRSRKREQKRREGRGKEGAENVEGGRGKENA